MPDPIDSELIQSIDQLREESAKREKIAKSALSLLKNAAAAAQKALKSLREYTELNPDQPVSDYSVFEAVKEQGLEPMRANLTRELRVHAKVLAALKEALAALRAEADVVRLGKAYAALESLNHPSVNRVLPTFQDYVRQANDDLAFNFGKQLKEALAARGLSIEVNPPRYEIGRFEVEVNFAKRAAVLRYGKDVVIPKVTLSVEGVLKAYDAADKLITQRAEDGTKWIETLYKAWEAVQRKQAGREPRVNLMDCYIEMVVLRQNRNFRIEPSKRNFADYTRAQFIFDLGQFVRLLYNGYRAHLHGATKSQTDSPDRTIWLVSGSGPHDGRYIADLVFEKES